MKIPKSTVYSMPTFVFMILFFGMGYFGHILYSNNFESIQARSIDDFRSEVYVALSEAKKETELYEDSNSIKSNSKNCPVKPLKHDLKSGVFTGIGRRFFSRRERLYAQCKSQSDDQLDRIGTCDRNEYWPSDTHRSHIMMNVKSQLAGCLVEKSGSSSWHKVFWMLRTPNAHFEGSKAYSINYGVMRKIKPEVWSKAFNDPTWIRFVTARHPLARLYSGWNRNLRRGGPMAQSLMVGMRLKYFIKEKDPDHVISWRDFLKFFSIAVRRYPKLINTHFIPIYNKCGLCLRQYDYIIKAETSTEDASIILNRINYNESELEHRNTADGSLADDPAAVGSFYKDIDPLLLDPILEYYKNDMQYLGYGLDQTHWKLTF